MPTSTEKGFSISNWESKYLRCRYRAHRNKIAAAKAAIDCTQPLQYPHIQYKRKKALNEEQRQFWIFQENLRILSTTADIMNERISHDSPVNSAILLNSKGLQISNSRIQKATSSNLLMKSRGKSAYSYSSRTTVSNTDSVSASLKRNNHVVFQWFHRRLGKYVPWWAQVRY